MTHVCERQKTIDLHQEGTSRGYGMLMLVTTTLCPSNDPTASIRFNSRKPVCVFGSRQGAVSASILTCDVGALIFSLAHGDVHHAEVRSVDPLVVLGLHTDRSDVTPIDGRQSGTRARSIVFRHFYVVSQWSSNRDQASIRVTFLKLYVCTHIRTYACATVDDDLAHAPLEP